MRTGSHATPMRQGLCLLYALVPFLAFVVEEGAAAAVPRSVLANGGGVASDATRRCVSTIGQAAIGASQGPSSAVCSGYWCVRPGTTVGVGDPGEVQRPARFSFGAPAPNPTRGGTTFALALPHDATVRLVVFDVVGRAIGMEWSEDLAAGFHRLVWKPSDETAGPGIYFIRLFVDGRLMGGRRVVRLR